MKLVNKIVFSAIAAALLFGTLSCSKKSANSEKKVKIGIAKIVQHVALDSVEQGIVDYLKDNGIDAEYDLQNANGDVNTAAQIALKYKDENVDVAVGIATPVALALANSIKDIPVVFGTITDPLGAGLVTTLDHGEGNVTGMSDAIPTEQHIALFKEIAGIKTLGYIYTSSEANSVSSLELVKNACQKLGLNLVTQSITNSSEVKQAAETIVNRVDGIYLTTDNTVFSALSSLIQVFENMRSRTHGSILIISHQERILNIADEIIVIADGQVKQTGSKDELLPELLKTTVPVTCNRVLEGGRADA